MDAGDVSAFRLSRWQLFAYGQLVVPMAVIGLPLAIYIPPFYSGTLGLNLGAVSYILMLARLSDVVTDPFSGRWSDRTHTRWGRRRPWVAIGVAVMMASSLMLFIPPAYVTNLYLLGWIAAIYLGYTLIEIPYGAWGAEISEDYHERNRITGSRQIFLLIGLLGAITVPIVASGAAPILGQSILADVCDLDTIKSGEQRTAFLFAFLAMVRKIFEAAGVGIALPILAWVGFNPASQMNSGFSLFMLTAMYCLVPLVLWITSTAVIWQYPITHVRQARLRSALDRRIARRTSVRRQAAD